MADPACVVTPSEALVTRSLLDIGALDGRIEEAICKYGTLKEFHIVLWRQHPDATGCNWNARLGWVRGSGSIEVSWWGVVPEPRERYNLK